MELVTLGHVTLNRVGSASMSQIITGRQFRRTTEIQDESLESLRELVLKTAEENGEPRGNLRAMWHDVRWRHPDIPEAIAFDIKFINVSYGDPYAICYAHPALKVRDRYFKLADVKI